MLYETLRDLRQANALSMHVPGHKNGTIGNLSEHIFLDFDRTEILGLDNLHAPESVLKELNLSLASKAPGYYAQAMVNGTTNGILSSMFAFSDDFSFVLLGDLHKSIYNALTLSKSSYTYIEDTQIFDASFQDKVLVLTSPSYEGRILHNLQAIVNHVKNTGGYVLIDAAHGAHLSITDHFPDGAHVTGADIVVESYHKMLPALTMASVIFVKERELYEKVCSYINQFETSSPSYLVLASIEYAQHFYNTYDDQIFFVKRQALINKLKALNISVTEVNDPAKLLLNSEDGPYQLNAQLIAQNIYSEMTTDEGVLWCLPLWHENDRYPFELLLERLEHLEEVEENHSNDVDLNFLIDKTCIENVVPYPPGVPLVLKGCVFTKDDIKTVKQYLFNHVKIEGIDNNINYYL
ncbi:hypothetical protein LNK15_06355 [Jeotgalicoccus huakuii]|nr:hypothetical protein [Jeotgalicoccus huakuii]